MICSGMGVSDIQDDMPLSPFVIRIYSKLHFAIIQKNYKNNVFL